MQNDLQSSTPSINEFDPTIIPYQHDVITLIRNSWHYERDGILELMLSGSVGCLREDALISTAFGEVPICDITKEHWLLTHHDRSNRFGLTRGSGAYPKGKDYLYRVVSEHGEFVASGNHLVATSYGIYRRVDDLFSFSSEIELPHVQVERDLTYSQSVLLLSALHYWETILSLTSHCVERIHQCGLRLPIWLSNVLSVFPSLVDAQEYGLFFYMSKLVHSGDFQGQELKPSRNVESLFHLSMMNFFCLLESKTSGVVDAYFQDDLKPCERTLHDILLQLLCQTHTAHPQDLLFFLSKFSTLLLSSFKTPLSSVTNASYKIERLTKKEWYWDIKVPNTNNYVCNGVVHHNSAKSLLMAHIALTHCIYNVNACLIICRKALPQLKLTIYKKMKQHLERSYFLNDYGEQVPFQENVHYVCNDSSAMIKFPFNGSSMIPHTWGDKNYEKVRSYEGSAAIVEELTENDSEEFEGFYPELKARIGRIPHIKESFIICATNPDGPSHSAYNYFIGNPAKNRKTFYSITTDNPFLPKTYINGLLETFTKEEARRMIYGEWVDLKTEIIYYGYNQDVNDFDYEYKVNPFYPIIISYDFNIGIGKPMSAVAFQYINGHYYFFEEVVIKGARTIETIEEFQERGTFNHPAPYYIRGDCNGKNKSTNYNKSDYDVIEEALRTMINSHGYIEYEIQVPASNPAVRTRHVMVNGLLSPAKGETKIHISKKCEVLREGFRKSKLKEGSSYIEDDSKPYQHITTAAGYGIMTQIAINEERESNVYKAR